MTKELLGLIQWAWRWDWVPAGGLDEPGVREWADRVTALFAEWASDDLAQARLAWPQDAAFPLTRDMVGQAAAEGLLDSAAQLPASAQLAWGAAFVEGKARWAPVPVVVHFLRPRAEDPNYLMADVGATGRDGDARPPVVDYVTTPIGDGVRVFAPARTPEGGACARVDAALRLDVPCTGVSVDVRLTTVVFDIGLMALIGVGVEQLMLRIADDCAPAAGPRRIAFTAMQRGAQ